MQNSQTNIFIYCKQRFSPHYISHNFKFAWKNFLKRETNLNTKESESGAEKISYRRLDEGKFEIKQ